jgi:hypothetical protein
MLLHVRNNCIDTASILNRDIVTIGGFSRQVLFAYFLEIEIENTQNID